MELSNLWYFSAIPMAIIAFLLGIAVLFVEFVFESKIMVSIVWGFAGVCCLLVILRTIHYLATAEKWAKAWKEIFWINWVSNKKNINPEGIVEGG